MTELIAKARGEDRSEAALQPERRRMLTGEQRREIQPAEREHRCGLAHAHAHRVPFAVQQPDLAYRIPWTSSPDLHRAIPRHVQRSRDGAVDDEDHLPRIVPLAPQDLPL